MESEGSRCAEDGVDGGIGDIAEFGVGLAGKISSREAGGRGISGTILIETGTGKEEVEGVFELKLEDVPRCFTVSVKNFITSHRGHEGVGTHTVPEQCCDSPMATCFDQKVWIASLIAHRVAEVILCIGLYAMQREVFPIARLKKMYYPEQHIITGLQHYTVPVLLVPLFQRGAVDLVEQGHWQLLASHYLPL